MRALALVILILPALAGCLAPAALDPAGVPDRADRVLHDLGLVLEASIPMGDGVDLHGTVYLPDVADGVKVPVVMDMGPYYGNLNPETNVHSEQHPPKILYEDLLRHGYAIALVSNRGTGQSGGCFMIGGAQERQDVATAVEWLAAQDWSDGTVAMTGVSYDGTTPWEGLVAAPPALKAIVPVEGISDFYRYSFYEGVPVGGGASFNTYYKALVDVAYTDTDGVIPWLGVQASALCPESAAVYAEPYKTYQDGVHGAYWDDRDMSAMLADAKAAVFVVHGFKDFNVKMDHVQTIWDALPGPKRMLVGQWAHNIPWRNTYDEKLSWHEYNETIRDFLDAYVRGDPAALERQQAAPPVLVQDSANVTWSVSAWPPVESAPAAFFLSPDGHLHDHAEEGMGEARLHATPHPMLRMGGPLAAARPAEVAWRSDAFAQATRFVGNPEVLLNVSVDVADGHLEARLYKVKGGERELVSLGWQSLLTRTSRDQAESVPTNTPMPIRIQMLAIAEVFEKGDALEIVLSADNTESLTPRVQATTFTVALGGAEGAQLVLPRFTQ